MSSSLVILFGVVKQFGSFWIWSETECKIPAEYGLLHNSSPSDTHCLYILYILFGKDTNQWVNVSPVYKIC